MKGTHAESSYTVILLSLKTPYEHHGKLSRKVTFWKQPDLAAALN